MRSVSSRRAPDFEQVGAALVDVGIFLVPQDVAPLVVEEHDALRQDLERFAQTLVGGGGGGDGGIGDGARAASTGAVADRGHPTLPRNVDTALPHHAARQLARTLHGAPRAVPLPRMFRHGSAAAMSREQGCLRVPNKGLCGTTCGARLICVRCDYWLSTNRRAKLRALESVGAYRSRPLARHMPSA